MKKIKIIKNRKRRQFVSSDPKKESIIKELAGLLDSYGFVVKRENLKQGIGWRAMSGSCRLADSKFIFVDRKLSQSDQISFLFNRCIALGVTPLGREESVSDETLSMFTSVAAA